MTPEGSFHWSKTNKYYCHASGFNRITDVIWTRWLTASWASPCMHDRCRVSLATIEFQRWLIARKLVALHSSNLPSLLEQVIYTIFSVLCLYFGTRSLYLSNIRFTSSQYFWWYRSISSWDGSAIWGNPRGCPPTYNSCYGRMRKLVREWIPWTHRSEHTRLTFSPRGIGSNQRPQKYVKDTWSWRYGRTEDWV